MENELGKKMTIQGVFYGGGRIRVSILDGIEVDFSGGGQYLIVRNQDRRVCSGSQCSAWRKRKSMSRPCRCSATREAECRYGRD